MLGNIEDLSQAGATECFGAMVKPDRLADIRKSVDEIRCKKDTTKGIAASLRGGKLLNLSFMTPQRTGKGNYHMMNAIADGASAGWNDIFRS